MSVCPSRLLAEAPWAEEFLEWWTWSVGWDGMSGQPIGVMAWPFPGGLLRQPRRLVDACRLLRDEWQHVDRTGHQRPQERTERPAEAPEPGA